MKLLLLLVALALVWTASAATGPSEAGAHKTPSWVLPLAPAGYGGPGVINPYSNVNPLNPMAAEMEGQAAGQQAGQSPQTQIQHGGPGAQAFLEIDDEEEVADQAEASLLQEQNKDEDSDSFLEELQHAQVDAKVFLNAVVEDSDNDSFLSQEDRR